MCAEIVSPRMRLMDSTSSHQRMVQLEQRVASMEGEIGSLLAKLRILAMDYEGAKLTGHVNEWHFDVIEPNFYFNNVYNVEIMDNGQRKRWVDQTGRIAHSVILQRDVAYTFTLEIFEYAHASYRDAMLLKIDGKATPWTNIDETRFTADIPPLNNAFKVDFEVSIDSAALRPENSVSFSFRKISIVRQNSGLRA